MSDVIISKKNEVYIKLECEPHILFELQPYFTFDVPSAKFAPAYRNKYWDGKIRLLSIQTGEIYVGLLDKVIEKLKAHNYTYKFIENKFYGSPFEVNENISFEGVKDYLNSISFHAPRDYQINGVYDSLKYNRKVLISPTGSGKSLMIYSIVRYFAEKNEKVLLITPTTSLVEQMFKDFISYGWDAESYCHKIYAGKEKTNEHPVTITTWQSIYNLNRSFFDDYTVVIGDECHTFKAKSLIGIMTKLHNAKYRFGFTGTLDGTQTHKWILEGLFGPSYKVTRTDELMEQGFLSKLDIQCIILKHPPQNFQTYEDEIQYLISNEKRNKFITNLSLSLKGNTLVLFSRVETHGAILYEKINSLKKENRKVFFVHGGVDTEERELVREITERENDAIIVASYGTFSTGINIQNLHNVIYASPSKSRIRNLQSIGRVLRKSKSKNKAMLYDIADDCSLKSKKNYTLNHFIERIKIYNEENFNYQIFTVTIKGEK
jgi:hypothetical protein